MSIPAIALAVCLAAALEYAVAEPPERFHPVAWLGQAIVPIDSTWNHPLVVGTLAALVLPLGFAGAAAAVVLAGSWGAGAMLGAGWEEALVSAIAAGVVLFTMTSYRMLLTEAEGVVLATATDLQAARDRLPALAGRDPSALSAGELRSAAVESAAENLSDGLVAPLLAFVVLAPFSLAVGVAAAAWVKGVNTLDSMLGYQSKAVGTPAARLDDLVMWVPARLSAGLLSAAAASPDPLLQARRWAGEPASPNAGWPMGTVAAAIGVRLEKPGAYVINPIASLPTVDDARRGIRLVGRTGLLAYGTAVGVGVMAWLS